MGRVAFKVLMDSLWNKEIAGCYTVDGFIQVLQVGRALCRMGASIGGPRQTVRLHVLRGRGRSMKAAILSQLFTSIQRLREATYYKLSHGR
ncbi:hypothetical protein Bca52824_046630 [Brassica carinata]|uniref:Uncharacterized protein n=1 Tax=Brassica carinata TaxID=52824 RepID=A0A8X7URB2_BRACI|nr:hypothetical protein Bca52824_046630 [Brassica carinata]